MKKFSFTLCASGYVGSTTHTRISEHDDRSHCTAMFAANNSVDDENLTNEMSQQEKSILEL